MNRSPFARWPGVAATARKTAAASTLALAGVAMAACSVDRTLSVADVDVATPANLNTAAGLPALYGGALADFQVQLTGVDASITMPGLMTDELRDIDTFPTRIEVDQRHVQTTNGTVQGWYRAMHRARASIARAIESYGKLDPNNANVNELHALEGYMFILFAEDWCNGVAYSSFNGTPVYGAANSGKQSLTYAVAQFDSTLAKATAKSAAYYLAEVGKGRALLDLGQYTQAAAAVADVPVTWQYLVYNSANSGSENSGVYINVGPPSKRFGIADNDGGNGLFFRSEGQDSSSKSNPTLAGDTRVRWYRLGVGQDGVSPAYYQLKYPDYTAKVVLADGIEAQLIQAESELKTGNANWLVRLNNLRSNATLFTQAPFTNTGQAPGKTLPPLTDPGTPAAQVDLLFHERAFWMFLTGHRLGDMRRLVTQYGRNTESVFPTGTYQGAAGGPMGSDVNFPITFDEQNNPQAKACTDRSAGFGS